jgi:hypothetical protein
MKFAKSDLVFDPGIGKLCQAGLNSITAPISRADPSPSLSA